MQSADIKALFQVLLARRVTVPVAFPSEHGSVQFNFKPVPAQMTRSSSTVQLASSCVTEVMHIFNPDFVSPQWQKKHKCQLARNRIILQLQVGEKESYITSDMLN